MTKNIDRKIKRQIFGKSHTARIFSPIGMLDICTQETQSILANLLHQQQSPPEIEVTKNSILIKDIDYRNLLQLTIESKTARDILWKISDCRVKSKSELENQLTKVDWDLYLPSEAHFAVRVSSQSSRLYHEGIIKSTFEEHLKHRGYIIDSKKSADFLIDLRLIDNQLTVYLSMSSGNLSKRGLKYHFGGAATIKEDIAASATAWSVAFANTQVRLLDASLVNIVNPFAGSGTLGFEAVLYFGKIPLSMLPNKIAFEKFACNPQSTLEFIKTKLKDRHLNSPQINLSFGEILSNQVEILKINSDAFRRFLPTLNFQKNIDVVHTDILSGNAWMGEPNGALFLVMNPPFGVRLKVRSAKMLYKKIGEWTAILAKQTWDSVSGYILAPDELTRTSFLHGLNNNFFTNCLDVIHGGKRIKIIAFTSK